MIVIPELINIGYFLTAAIILLLIPGPAVLFIMVNSIKYGIKAGFTSVLGIGIGGLVHVVGVALGVSAILVASTYAFLVLKYLGAVYLIYLGIKSIMSKGEKNITTKDQKVKSSKILIDGIVVNIFNPKTAIFFLAFLPQFVSIDKGYVASQLIFLGFTFIVLALICDSIYVLLSGSITRLLERSDKFLKWKDRIVGSIYISLGLLTLVMDQPNKTTSNK